MRSHLWERVRNRAGEEGQQLSLRPWLGIPLPPRVPEECQTLNSHFLKLQEVFTPTEGEISQIASGQCAERRAWTGHEGQGPCVAQTMRQSTGISRAYSSHGTIEWVFQHKGILAIANRGIPQSHTIQRTSRKTVIEEKYRMEAASEQEWGRQWAGQRGELCRVCGACAVSWWKSTGKPGVLLGP